MKLLYSLVLLYLLVQNNCTLGNTTYLVSDMFSAANSIVKVLGKEYLNLIRRPEEIFKASQEVLSSLPEMALSYIINDLCSLYMAANTTKPRIAPDIETMSFVLRTPCKNSTFPLKHAEKILNSSDFDVNKKVAIMVSGWLTKPESGWINDMTNAFYCRGNYNVLSLDPSDSIRTLYIWSSYNCEEIGRQLAFALAKLLQQVPSENIHLIGHSLGAHIVGYAGRYFTANTGLNITRITGLDPGNPCFNEGHILSGLQRGDAEFIDVIHSNPGFLGKRYPIGDADFYPGGLALIKPGCFTSFCSHGRSYEYFIESIYTGNEKNFLATRCTTLTRLKRGRCNGKQYPMGFAVPNNLKGNYFLNVNAKSPYGQNHNSQNAVSSECGKCKNVEMQPVNKLYVLKQV